MATTINASNGSTSGLISTGDASGVLQLQVNNGTPALTLNTTQALGVGSSPAYGTSGQFLTSQGSGAAPTWTSAPASAMTLISTQTASGGSQTSLAWTGLSGYSKYMLVMDAVAPQTADSLYLQYGQGSTPTYVTSSYFRSNTASGTGGAYFNQGTSTTGTSIILSYYNTPATLSQGLSGSLFFAGFNSSTIYKYCNGVISYYDSSNTYYRSGCVDGGYLGNTNPITAIKIYSATGYALIDGSTASLYGISS